ncbi:recombinase family protein [Pseudomonas sp. MAFF 730085]|uniref:Recombinase family protein n=1 Tax=Pseudomonas kitaguniensis TaxID=2607908 RepID=A0A5N7JS61_9PSED|nr:recombinase family protein [Pseudomonas kitaguniensis]
MCGRSFRPIWVYPGDTLVVTRIDRLARSIKDLQDIVCLEATEQPIDTLSAAGKAFLDMLGVFAEFETNLRRERQLEEIADAINEKTRQRASFKGLYGHLWPSVEQKMVPEPGIEPGRPYERGILSPQCILLNTTG